MTTIKGIVNSVSGPRDFNGVMQIGFTMKADPKKWYNVPGEEEALSELKGAVVMKGSEISFPYDEAGKKVGDITMVSLPKEGSKENWADDMTSFEDLLESAHTKFQDGFSINTEMLQVDFKDKKAVFKATVTVSPGKKTVREQVYQGHGDAEGISTEIIKPHFMRMAETRAIARALRWATNTAATAEEETGEGKKPEKVNKKEGKKDGKPSTE